MTNPSAPHDYTGHLTKDGITISHPADDGGTLHFAPVSGSKGEALTFAGKFGHASVNAERTQVLVWVGDVRLTMSCVWERHRYVLTEVDYSVRERSALPGEKVA